MISNKFYVSIIIICAIFYSCDSVNEEYYENGNLKSTTEYIVDTLINERVANGKMTKYFVSGEVMEVSNWVSGQKDGLTKKYYKNGNLELEASFRDGLQDGWTFFYDSSGILKSKVLYKLNKPAGQYVEFYSDGTVFKEIESDIDTLTIYEYFDDGDLERCYINYNEETLYAKSYDRNGNLINVYFPFTIYEVDSQVCFSLNLSIHDNMDVNVHITKPNQSGPRKDDLIINGKGLNLCTNKSSFSSETISGFICEVDNEGTYLGWIYFEYNIAS